MPIASKISDENNYKLAEHVHVEINVGDDGRVLACGELDEENVRDRKYAIATHAQNNLRERIDNELHAIAQTEPFDLQRLTHEHLNAKCNENADGHGLAAVAIARVADEESRAECAAHEERERERRVDAAITNEVPFVDDRQAVVGSIVRALVSHCNLRKIVNKTKIF